ncbi:hypothetical protein SCALM49S_09159 [Streptomyces californicus]
MYKMGARYYDPDLGRFTQPDPSGQEANPYLYAASLVNRTDPTGLFSFSDILDNGSDIFGVVSGCVAGIGAASRKPEPSGMPPRPEERSVPESAARSAPVPL